MYRMASSGMFRRVALVGTDVSEELSSSFIRMTRLGELGITFAVISNRPTLHTNVKTSNLTYHCTVSENVFCLKYVMSLVAYVTRSITYVCLSVRLSVCPTAVIPTSQRGNVSVKLAINDLSLTPSDV
jgi:hypothetical protein